MRIAWYFAFARPEELPLACAVVGAGDELTVQVVDRLGAAETAECAQVHVRRDLPEVNRGSMPGPQWLLSRAGTYVRRARSRARFLREVDPEICHIHYLNRFTDPFKLRRMRMPVVLSVHDVLPHDSRLPLWLEHALLSSSYKSASALVVHHQRLRDLLVEQFGLDPASIHVLPHQVFDYGPRTLPPPTGRRVLFFGAL